MSGHEREIVFENVSKFYGEVLGVNRVNLTIPPGITRDCSSGPVSASPSAK